MCEKDLETVMELFPKDQMTEADHHTIEIWIRYMPRYFLHLCEIDGKILCEKDILAVGHIGLALSERDAQAWRSWYGCSGLVAC